MATVKIYYAGDKATVKLIQYSDHHEDADQDDANIEEILCEFVTHKATAIIAVDELLRGKDVYDKFELSVDYYLALEALCKARF